MKKIIYTFVFAAVVSVTGCKSSQQAVVQKENTSQTSVEPVIGRDFVQALRSNNFDLLEQYVPTVEVAKVIGEKETEGLSDQEIQNNLIDPLVDKMRTSFQNISEELKKNNINLKQLKLYSAKEFEADSENPELIKIMNITIGDESKSGTFPVTFFKSEDRYYWFEVLVTKNIRFDLIEKE